MLDAFLATLRPMLTLFLIIAIGFLLRKGNVLSAGSAEVIAKLETWVFCPALSFYTMINYCTVSSLKTHALNVIISLCGVGTAILIGILLSRIFAKENSNERGIYCYAFAFANSGYMGDPIVQALFGDEALSYYKIFCLPINILIMTWGLSLIIPRTKNGSGIKNVVFNPSLLAMIIGVLAGISGLGKYMPDFVMSALDTLKSCMGPVAMLLAGVMIAGYGTRAMLSKKKVYIASLLRLVFIPAFIITLLFGAKELINLVFRTNIDNGVLHLSFFALAMPLGLNTIVFPAAYGGDSETGASMALVSHAMSIITIPLLYSLMTVIFGNF